MMDYYLLAEELAELRAAHRSTRDKREADRITTVVLLASDWGADDVADALLVDPNTVRNYFMALGSPLNRSSVMSYLREDARGPFCPIFLPRQSASVRNPA